LNSEQNHQLNEARFQMVEAMFAYAHKEHIPFVLTAGDQFDSAEFKSTELLTRLFGTVKQYRDVTCIAITGNHDPLMPASIYSRLSPELYPENFRLVRGGETVDLSHFGCTIFAASLAEKRGRENPLTRIPADENGAGGTARTVRVGLGHGSLAVPGKFQEDDFPIKISFAAERGLDYLALGHWHSFYQADERTCYPGAPLPMKFDEQGAILDVSIDGPGGIPRIEKAPIEPAYTWEKKEVLLDDANYRSSLENASTNKRNAIGELTIRGVLSPNTYREAEQIIEGLPASWFSLTVDNRTSIKPSPDEIPSADDIGYLRSVIETLLEGEEDVGGDGREDVKTRALEKIFLFLSERGFL
jgi:DNA repair exonuclease SbcCD nuclease subunit